LVLIDITENQDQNLIIIYC